MKKLKAQIDYTSKYHKNQVTVKYPGGRVRDFFCQNEGDSYVMEHLRGGDNYHTAQVCEGLTHYGDTITCYGGDLLPVIRNQLNKTESI